MDSINFRPRRLGHVNLWVHDLDRSIAFYEGVCGVQLVRREPELRIAFHSNGNTHHDLGLAETSRGRDRFGRDGSLQIPKDRGLVPGVLNHIGWEMETEKDLVAAYDRAAKVLGKPPRSLDHIISHSVYVADPDGNVQEFYADDIKNWRSVFNLEAEETVTAVWDPHARPPTEDRNFHDNPAIQKVAGAPIPTSHLTGVVFATRRFDEMVQFLVSTAGLLQTGRSGTEGSRVAQFAGVLGGHDFTLVEDRAAEKIGIQTIRFEIAEHVDLQQIQARVDGRGVPCVVSKSKDGTEKLTLRDPDGFQLEFYQKVEEHEHA